MQEWSDPKGGQYSSTNGAKQPTEAKCSMEGRENRARVGSLDDDPLCIHCHIEHAISHAEYEERKHERGKIDGESQKRQRRTIEYRGNTGHRFAAAICDKPSR